MSVRYLEQNEEEVQSTVAATAPGRESMSATAAPVSSEGHGRAAPPSLAGVRRPARPLLAYYSLWSILTGPALLVLLPLRYFRYRTLHYVFDDEGVTMRWGLLFRREITLTYARIQDIHLVSNIVERWLGIGRVQIQTASGKSGAEMTIEGLPDYEAVRDRLYARMRGAREVVGAVDTDESAEMTSTTELALTDVVTALEAAVTELRALRADLTREQDRQ